MKLVVPRLSVLYYLIYPNRNFWRPRHHTIDETQEERCPNLLQPVGPVLLYLPILDPLTPGDYFAEPLALDCDGELIHEFNVLSLRVGRNQVVEKLQEPASRLEQTKNHRHPFSDAPGQRKFGLRANAT
jgi:hypothetical protein